MSKKISISLSDYVLDEIIGESKNRSEVIEELIVKGFMAKSIKNILTMNNNQNTMQNIHNLKEINGSGEKIWYSDFAGTSRDRIQPNKALTIES